MTEVLIVSGRAGSGKTTAGFEIAQLLKRKGVHHALLDADFLDAMYPEEQGAEMMLLNLGVVWANYHRRGIRRLVIVGTAVAMEADMVKETMAQASEENVHVTTVVLTVSDDVARARLTRREVGSELDDCLQSSYKMARVLDGLDCVKVDAEKDVLYVARSVLWVAGWIDSGRLTQNPV